MKNCKYPIYRTKPFTIIFTLSLLTNLISNFYLLESIISSYTVRISLRTKSLHGGTFVLLSLYVLRIIYTLNSASYKEILTLNNMKV